MTDLDRKAMFHGISRNIFLAAEYPASLNQFIPRAPADGGKAVTEDYANPRQEETR